MPGPSDYPAIGKVLSVSDDAIIFQPRDSNYELKLATDGKPACAAGERIECLIRATARKLYSVSAGGSFVVPIFGPPRIVQGRIKYLDEKQMVVQAGAPVVVEFPSADSGFDMECGPLAVGQMVNAVCLPGVKMELLAPAVAR